MLIRESGSDIALSRDEIIERIDKGARQRRGVSGRSLIAAYQEGRLEQAGDVADLLVLAELLEDNDPFFPAA